MADSSGDISLGALMDRARLQIAPWIAVCSWNKEYAMEGRPQTIPISTMPLGAERSAHAVQQARLLFERTLCGWTSDLLRLRRAGANQPMWPDIQAARLRRAA